MNGYWISFAIPTTSAISGSGLLASTGQWLRRCGTGGVNGTDLVVVDLTDPSEAVQTAISRAPAMAT